MYSYVCIIVEPSCIKIIDTIPRLSVFSVCKACMIRRISVYGLTTQMNDVENEHCFYLDSPVGVLSGLMNYEFCPIDEALSTIYDGRTTMKML